MIWDFMNPHKISANSNHKQKSFIPKKNGVLLFETVKNLIFWIVTHVSTRDYTVGTFYTSWKDVQKMAEVIQFLGY